VPPLAGAVDGESGSRQVTRKLLLVLADEAPN